jgi:hypothetical protein
MEGAERPRLKQIQNCTECNLLETHGQKYVLGDSKTRGFPHAKAKEEV